MALLIHLVIALTSIVYATYLFLSPSKRKLHISYGFVVGTIASGTYLTLVTHANLLSACATGLLYTSGISVIIVATHYKLAVAKTKNIKN